MFNYVNKSYNYKMVVNGLNVIVVFFVVFCLESCYLCGRIVLIDLWGMIIDGFGNYLENKLCEWFIKGR